MAKIRIVHKGIDYAALYPDDAWQCDIFLQDGSDYHGVGNTAEEAAERATAYWIAQEREKQRDKP